MKNLILAAHPDDEVLGCGGTIARRVKEGEEFIVAIITDGALTRYKKSMIRSLRNSAIECSRMLGVSKVIFKDMPNQMLDTIPITKVIQAIEAVISEVNPDTVYTHDKGDLNRDHAIIHEATLVAARPLPGAPVKTVLTYFTPSSSEYNDVDGGNIFIPNIFVDIKKSIDAKIRAFGCYKSEARPYPHPRSPEALKVYAKRWGIQSGIEYAEPFRLVRTTAGVI